jgi:hypothetical protein
MGAQGPAGIVGLEYTQTNYTVIGNSTTGLLEVEAPCPSSKRILGGGHFISPATAALQVAIPASRPNGTGDGWLVQFYTPQPYGSWVLISYAICATA